MKRTQNTHTIVRYRGRDIEYNLYGENEYTVQYCGDDMWFMTEREAMQFIDAIIDIEPLIDGI